MIIVRIKDTLSRDFDKKAEMQRWLCNNVDWQKWDNDATLTLVIFCDPEDALIFKLKFSDYVSDYVLR